MFGAFVMSFCLTNLSWLVYLIPILFWLFDTFFLLWYTLCVCLFGSMWLIFVGWVIMFCLWADIDYWYHVCCYCLLYVGLNISYSLRYVSLTYTTSIQLIMACCCLDLKMFPRVFLSELLCWLVVLYHSVLSFLIQRLTLICV